MFQTLRSNSQIFVLHKDGTPYIESGTVVSVTPPMPKNPFPSNFGHPQEFVVDVVARINDQNITYSKLPANQEIADFGSNGSIVVSISKDAMNAEVASMKQRSYDIINSVEYHRSVIDGCDKILQSLNPEYAEKQQQQAEINGLKTQMGEMARNMAELMAANRQLLERLGGADETSPKKSSNKQKEQ